MYKFNTKCRICSSSKLTKFLDLGAQPLANAFVKNKISVKENYYPLEVYFCHKCNHSQLCHVVDKKELFSHYIYFTSNMPTPQHFIDYAQNVAERFKIKKNDDLIVEIGSNDGLLLSAFIPEKIRILGVDPAKNIAKIANERGVPTVADFFGEKCAQKIEKEHGKAKIIIGNNVVAHIDEKHDLMRGIATLLKDDGVFIFEAPYLMDMFENGAYDTIYHEHVCYLSIRPLQYLCSQFGMEIFDVELHNAQGTSIRVFVAKKGMHKIKPNVAKLVKKELLLKMNKLETYKKLAKRIMQSKIKLLKTLSDLKAKGKKIAGYGAPAKGNTLLNYCKIGPETLDYLTEELPTKIGLFSPGMHIPVIDIREARKNPPDYFLMLAWNYRHKIIPKEKEYIAQGGKFIIPIGDIQII
ncbi:MAG: class I SAM-dependent methyltransferase [Patescibacteria group bacterium]